ncbi:MAG: glucosamine-6-phosphate deaminase [Mycoplasmatales bacterium]
MINLVIKKQDELFKDIAQVYQEQLKVKANSILGLATGSSPIGLYEELIKLYNKQEISFKEVITFNLDEYCNLAQTDKNSYFSFMQENLFTKVDINTQNTNFPPTDEAKISEYETKLQENIIDIQLLGIGSNGHIAFNEPGSNFNSTVRIVDLDEKTIQDNARFFTSVEEVPTQAASMGLADIMRAKKIILIAIGENKAEVLKEIFANDEITNKIPATLLKNHPDVTFYVDEVAGKYLK